MRLELHSCLIEIRKKYGHASARSFYQELSAKADLCFNYSYYMKIESGDLIPSEKVVQQLSSLIPNHDGDLLIKAYCTELFPKVMPRLLKDDGPVKASKKANPKQAQVRGNQQILTARQVAVIAKSQYHYYSFLIITLARDGITLDDITEYKISEAADILADLVEAKLIFAQKNLYFPSHPESKFPPTTPDLKNYYGKLDAWDAEKASFFNLDRVKKASFFKRISPKYLELLLMNFEMMFQLIRSADETDINYNTEVISLELIAHAGKIKG